MSGAGESDRVRAEGGKIPNLLFPTRRAGRCKNPNAGECSPPTRRYGRSRTRNRAHSFSVAVLCVVYRDCINPTPPVAQK